MKSLIVSGFVLFAMARAQAWTSIGRINQFGVEATPAATSLEYLKLTEFMNASRKGGTVKVSWFETILSVFPTAIRNGDFRPRAPFAPDFTFEYLMTTDPRQDETTVYPLATRDVSVSPNYCTIRVTLRDDVRFSDGTPLTAQSVKFSLDRYLNEFFTGALSDLVHRIAGRMELKVVDRLTFETSFHEIAESGCRQAAFYFLSGVPLIKPNPEAGPGEKVDMPYIGTGPYRVVTRTPNLVRLQRNPNYWARDLEVRKSLFNPDVIEAHVYMEPMVERLAFLRGDLTLLRETKFTYDEWMAREKTRHDFVRIDQVNSDNALESGAVWMNQLHEHTGNLQFRRALLLVWDLEQSSWAFFADRRHALEAPGARSRHYPKGVPSPAVRELLARGKSDPAFGRALDAMEDNDYVRASRVQPMRERLRQALAILNEAGYAYRRANGQTRLTKDGRPVRLVAVTRTGSPEGRLFLRFRNDLAKIGIELEIREMGDRSTLVAALQNNQYDFLPSGVTIPRSYEVLDTSWLIAELHSTSIKALGSWGRMRSPMIDATLDEMERLTPAHPDFPQAGDAFLRAFTANVPILPSGEIDPVITYHHTPLHVWNLRSRDLWTAYF